jgi:hypothetical protein
MELAMLKTEKWNALYFWLIVWNVFAHGTVLLHFARD